jgi:hypothetical protein
MAAYGDAVGLARAKDVDWKLYNLEQDPQGFTEKKEEVATFFLTLSVNMPKTPPLWES